MDRSEFAPLPVGLVGRNEFALLPVGFVGPDNESI